MMTPEERTKQLNTFMEQLPGKRVERIRAVAKMLCCEENTIRIYLVSNTPRPIPEAKLKILKREVERLPQH